MAQAVAARLKRLRPATGEEEAPERAPVKLPKPAPPAYHEGEAVLGNFKGMGDWDEALVVGILPNGNYVLEYTDEGLIEEDVPASRVAKAGAADALTSAGVSGGVAEGEGVTYREGETVLGNFKGMGDWDEALVVGILPNGNYVLEYTDEGLLEEDVPASRVAKAGGGVNVGEVEGEGATYTQGETVLGNFKGMGDWDEALVVGILPNGNYVLEYTDEGLIEEDVPASRVAKAGAADALASAAMSGGGAAVAAASPAGSDSPADEEEDDADSSDDQPEASSTAPFVAASGWRGARHGYCFKRGELGLGYYKDVPLLELAQRAERESMVFSAPQLANWLLELYAAPPSVKKLDRYMELFDAEGMRVRTLSTASAPLFDSLLTWFDASKQMLARPTPPGAVQVNLRVFLEPKQSVRHGIKHATFSVDWIRVEACDEEPISSSLLRKMGMTSRRPQKMLLVVMYKAEGNRITNIWADVDREGLGMKKGATLDDVLISDIFDQCLTLARKSGAVGGLEPVFHNYYDLPLISL
ncbi:hypothetical protein AB1Y20_010218 [Prymnesium parvum]|uniref:Uncharacterized protein n=1 Tax=Prymnesium parvum TaxID=97485 RepID=A0AB34K7C9_PRYPA